MNNCSPPERRYNLRRPEERRKPDRLGYGNVSKLDIVNNIVQMLLSSDQ